MEILFKENDLAALRFSTPQVQRMCGGIDTMKMNPEADSPFFAGSISMNEAFEFLFENASDAIYILDKRGNFVTVNRKAEEMTGFVRKDFIGKSFRKIIPNKSLPKAIKSFLTVMRGREVRLELEIKKANGGKVLSEVTSTPLVSNGKIVGTFGIVRDITQRVATEKRLEEANKKLKMLFETALEGITVIDPEENIKFANKAFADMLGYAETELLGRNLRIIVDDEGFEAVKKETLNRKEGNISRYEVVLYRKDRQPKVVQVSASPLYENGVFQGSLGIVMDVTERKRAEKALRESEQRFKRLFEGSPEAAVVTDITDHVLGINSRFSELFGYSATEANGKLLDDLIVPDDARKEAKMLTEKSMKGYINYEAVRKRKDGTLVPTVMSAAPIIVEDQFKGSIVLYLDITRRKKAEEALRNSEEKFRKIFQSANDGMVYLDTSGRILEVNDSVVRIFGGKREELLGEDFARVGALSNEDLPRVIRAFADIISGGEPTRFDVSVKNKKGEVLILESSASVMKSYEKQPTILVILRDITARRQMEKKLEEYSGCLEKLVEERTKQLKETQAELLKTERLAAIGEIAAMVGHDLRNPLTGIVGATYYLKKKLGSRADGKAREMLELIENNVGHSNRIISDLLDYSRDIRLELKDITPRTIMNESLSLVVIPQNVCVVDETEDKPIIRVDVEKMERVFTNLIKNAIDAMPDGGELVISSVKKRGTVEFCFSDTGIGMSQETMAKIFVPLFTTKAKGMGLGLPICKRIVEAHGGRISVESAEDKGATFTVAIPVAPKLEGGEKVWVDKPESLLSMMTKT